MISYRGGQAIVDIQISYRRDIRGCDKRDWASLKEVLLCYCSIRQAIEIHVGDPESDIDHRDHQSIVVHRVGRLASSEWGGWVIIVESSSFLFLLPPFVGAASGWSGTEMRDPDARNKTDVTCVRGFVGRCSESRDDRIYPTILHVTPSRCTPLPPPPPPPSRRRCGLVTPTLPCLSSPLLSLLLVSLTPVPWAHREQGSSRTTRPSVESSRKREKKRKRERGREECTRELQRNLLLQHLCVTDGAEKCNWAMGLERRDSSTTSEFLFAAVVERSARTGAPSSSASLPSERRDSIPRVRRVNSR